MDLCVIFKPPAPYAIMAYVGMFSTFILAYTVTLYLHYSPKKSLHLNLALSILAAGNSSPVLTCVKTNLKIGKSDIGRLGTTVGVHTDMISTFFITLASLFSQKRRTFLPGFA